MLIITPDYRNGVKYTARDISEVRPEHVEIAKTSVIAGESVAQGVTVIDYAESYEFPKEYAANYMRVKGRDHTFGAFYFTNKGWAKGWPTESWYYNLQGASYPSMDKNRILISEDEARAFLISQYKKNAWGV